MLPILMKFQKILHKCFLVIINRYLNLLVFRYFSTHRSLIKPNSLCFIIIPYIVFKFVEIHTIILVILSIPTLWYHNWYVCSYRLNFLMVGNICRWRYISLWKEYIFSRFASESLENLVLQSKQMAVWDLSSISSVWLISPVNISGV